MVLLSFTLAQNPIAPVSKTKSQPSQTRKKLTQRRKKPPILPTRIPILQRLLHRLLRLLPLANLLKRIIRHHPLQPFQLQRVACRHQMVVVHNLDERLHLAALRLALFRHLTGDLEGVAFNAGDEGVREGMRFRACVEGLDDYDL